MAADRPEKHIVMQAAMTMHLSQSTGAGALVGQHGISPVISSVVADMDMSSAIAAINPSEGAPAMTGRDSGVNANPAITRIASSRRMMIWRSIPPKSHRSEEIESLPG